MGQTTPNISIYIPSAGETDYDQSFSAGMINIDQHDHSGGPNKGLPIATEGLGDFSVTFDKLAPNVVDPTTGIGVSGALPNQIVMLDPLKAIFQLAPASGFISMDGTSAHVRTFTVGTGLNLTNPAGVAGNPLLTLTSAVALSVIGTASEIAVTPTANTYQIALAPIVQKSTQPLFLAQLLAPQDNVTGDGTAYTVLFPNVAANQGGYYDAGTSVFTVPVTGYYLLGVNLLLADITSGSTTQNQTDITFWVSGVPYRRTYYADTRAINAAGTSNVQLSCTEFVKLLATQVVTVVLTVTSVPSGKFIDIDEAYFSGVLLW